MTNRERILTILAGGKPDRIPIMPFSELFPRGEFEREMRDRGMGMIVNATSVWSETPHIVTEYRQCDGIETSIYHTPGGDLSKRMKTHVGRISNDSSVDMDWVIKEEKDFEAAIAMIEDMEFHVEPDQFWHIDEELGGDGVTHTWTGEPPYMDAQYFMGYVQWSYNQFDYPEQFARLLEALGRRQDKWYEAVLSGPEKYLINIGNLAGNFSPGKYGEYILPFYEKYMPVFRERGKICTIHADALNLKEHAELVRRTGIDVVEAFTPPPVGNLSLADARRVWGEGTTIWINMPETVFFEGYEATKRYVIELLKSDPCPNKFIGFTEMGLMGVQNEQLDIFKNGFRAVMDAIDEVGEY